MQNTYNLSKSNGGLIDISFEDFRSMIKQNHNEVRKNNQDSWDNNRPGSYETWQQLAKVIVTNDTKHYKPSLPSNTHWKY